MAVAGSGSRPSRPRARGGAGRVIWWLILIVFGFYCGVQTTKWAVTGPDYARRVLGVSAPAPTAVTPISHPISVPVSGPPPAQPQNPPAGDTPKTTPKTGAPEPGDEAHTAPNPADSSGNANTSVPGNPGNKDAAHTSGTPGSSATDQNGAAHTATQPAAKLPTDLDSQVKLYNSTLRDLQQAARDYLTEASATAQGGSDATDQSTKTAEQFSSELHKAQSLYDAITANPGYAKKYVEKDPALASAQIPQGLPAIGADQLHFIRAK